jgi:hypothetical protein
MGFTRLQPGVAAPALRPRRVAHNARNRRPNFGEGVKALALADAALESYRTGRAVGI